MPIIYAPPLYHPYIYAYLYLFNTYIYIYHQVLFFFILLSYRLTHSIIRNRCFITYNILTPHWQQKPLRFRSHNKSIFNTYLYSLYQTYTITLFSFNTPYIPPLNGFSPTKHNFPTTVTYLHITPAHHPHAYLHSHITNHIYIFPRPHARISYFLLCNLFFFLY